MFVLGHAGITLGATALLNGIIRRGATGHLKRSPEPALKVPVNPYYHRNRIASWFGSLGDIIDIRFLLIGSLLPDIIDKPVGVFLFRETFSSGRVYGHTLLFLIVISLVGLLLYRSYRKNWLLVVSFGTLVHFILDRMWSGKEILLWPLYGFAFEREDLDNWWQAQWHGILTEPGLYIPEIVGGVILVLLLWVVVRNRKVFTFIRNGKLR
jgi:inner membrane protein